MGNPVTRWQILAHDPDKLAMFYQRLFDWNVSTDNAMGYREIDTGSKRGIAGGIWPIPKETPASVSLYVEVQNLETTIEQAKALGAAIAIPPQQLPDGDAMAVIVDPEGIAVGLFKAGRKA